jgi:hypothetical protein
LAEALKNAFDLEVELISGARGEFSVWFKEKMICQKTISGYPSVEEIIELLRKELDT